jgi:hypothetical protein
VAGVIAWLLVLPGTVLLDSLFGVNNPDLVVYGLTLSAFGFLLLTVFTGFAHDVQGGSVTFEALDEQVTWTTRSKGEDHRVVGGLTVGILEWAYGLDRPHSARFRRLGTVAFLQRRPKRELVRPRVPARCWLSSPGFFGREGPKGLMTRAAGNIGSLLHVAITTATKGRYYYEPPAPLRTVWGQLGDEQQPY